MPKEVEVIQQQFNWYIVCTYNTRVETHGVVPYFAGNGEQVHTWLAEHGYKQQNTVIQGTYRREGLGNAA